MAGHGLSTGTRAPSTTNLPCNVGSAQPKHKQLLLLSYLVENFHLVAVPVVRRLGGTYQKHLQPH